MKKFFVFLMCLSLVVLVSCGGSGDSGGEEAGGGSGDSGGGEKGGESGRTTSKSIGTNSLTTKDLSLQELYDSCVTEMANALYPGCSWQNDEEQARKRISEIKGLNIFFGDECKDPDTDEKVECPDFILSSLYILGLEGCEVYSIDPESECIAPCADIYFSARYFTRSQSDVIGHERKVYVGANFDDKNFIKGDDGTVPFISDFNLGDKNKAVFSWSEKAEDGTETVKKVTLSATVKPESDDIEEECFWTRCSH